jgi:hypothetical protein
MYSRPDGSDCRPAFRLPAHRERRNHAGCQVHGSEIGPATLTGIRWCFIKTALSGSTRQHSLISLNKVSAEMPIRACFKSAAWSFPDSPLRGAYARPEVHANEARQSPGFVVFKWPFLASHRSTPCGRSSRCDIPSALSLAHGYEPSYVPQGSVS